MQLAGEVGPEAVSVREAARPAGVSLGAPFRHSPGRDAPDQFGGCGGAASLQDARPLRRKFSALAAGRRRAVSANSLPVHDVSTTFL
ncbi:TetR/AcrR family transcriptional regulator [Bradyrhizobium jicamae]|uniref:TetR/AcrR family transcriptional regulator n=1 Tax=Bradyrhizobium jicamae TaxID=280332 RepID=UPI00201283FA|nr:TetR/AcrR family transcriptional regulator [Bradyrhizobium jicamae]